MKELILIVSIILFSVVLLYFRRKLKAFLFRLIYGDYHINYLRLFYDGDSYYNSFYPSKSTLYNQISNIRSAINSKSASNTQLPLFFQNIEYGISSRKLISLIGKPFSHDVISLGSEKVVSLEYNFDQYNVVDKYVYYFKNDKYYMGEFHFNKVKEDTSNEILNSVNAKYNTNYSGNEDFVIRNINGNFLNYKDLGYRISVSYFCENSEEINFLLNYQEEFRRQKKAEYDYQLNIQHLTF